MKIKMNTDSCENYFDINLLFEIKQFYDKHFLQFAKDNYGIYFNYDLEVGLSYGEMMSLKVINDKTVEISGAGSIVQGLLWKIHNESDLEVSTDIPEDQILPIYEFNPAKRFIKERQCCMIRDESNYTVQLTKLN